jgi:hypothetical protein
MNTVILASEDIGVWLSEGLLDVKIGSYIDSYDMSLKEYI